MKIESIMNKNVIFCKSDDKISSIANKLKMHNISGMPVIEENEVVGIISEADLLRLLKIPEREDLLLPSPFEIIELPIRELISLESVKKTLTNIGSKPVKSIMETNISVISKDSSIEDASKLMIENKINRLPVVDGKKLIGIVTRGDIIQGLAKSCVE
ncbi:MAG: CBS domain-containing protein [Methanosarcinaceae archaeon]|nr:CBS domain-containing protein [Methanosarcinaceae archaeon]NKQ39759.1 CBS domain-containing protein [Methanosarcinales archaeon]